METTTFIWPSETYLPTPLSLLSPAGDSGTVTFDLPARIVAVPLTPAAGIFSHHGR